MSETQGIVEVFGEVVKERNELKAKNKTLSDLLKRAVEIINASMQGECNFCNALGDKHGMDICKVDGRTLTRGGWGINTPGDCPKDTLRDRIRAILAEVSVAKPDVKEVKA